MLIEKSNRIFGLDLLRVIAILIVVKNHCSPLWISVFPRVSYAVLPDGVDVFFVLSGFLIGGQLIQRIEERQAINFEVVSVFLKRRWLRTLPNYFLFLLINLILIYFGLIKGEINKYFITYLVFYQNFVKPYDFLFWESWSLSIEEWFYLLFPLILFMLYKIKPAFFKIKHVFFSVILLFIFFPIIYRYFHVCENIDVDYWDLYIRKLVISRFDCIGIGLLGAFIKFHQPIHWIRYKNISFFIGCNLLLLMIFKFNHPYELGVFFQVFYFTLIGLSILLVLPVLDNLKNEKLPFKPFEFLSKRSFAIYLIHIPLFQIFDNYFTTKNNLEESFIFIFYSFCLIIISNLVYKYFEKPFMDRRTKG